MSSFVALRILLSYAPDPLGPFDEALLFVNAQLMQDGRVPYRDFYSNYPPGIFQIVRLALDWASSPIWTMRCVAFVVQVVSAALAALLVGRAQHKRWSLATFSLIVVLRTDLGLPPLAYAQAVLLVLVMILCWPRLYRDVRRTVLCALLFGFLSYLRHDLFIYMSLPLVALELLWWLRFRHSLLFFTARQLQIFVGVVAAVVIALWSPVFVQAGLSRVAHDLYLDQVGAVMASRTKPLPDFFAQRYVPGLSLTLPAFLAEATSFGLVLAFAAVAAALLTTAYQLVRTRWPTQRTRLLVLCSVAGLATLPQALGRTDYWHVAFVVPLVATAGFRVLGARTTQTVSLFAIVLLFATPRPLIGLDALKRFFQATDANLVTDERRYLTNFIVERVPPGEAIFMACQQHRRVIMSVLDLHYLAHRPNATRYMQYDPGLVTTAEKQLEMIADLERTRPRLVFRYLLCSWDEPNASIIEGSSLLDEYLDQTFVRERRLSQFDIWRRR
jgi:hypothetical protein